VSNELAVIQPGNLTEEMDYAKAVSVASMLPDTYRNKPADIMLAVGLGRSMGLSPAESLYRISVIKGKPTASAELIAANVRKAGHRLRVRGDETSATCTITRADDPDYEFTVTRDMAWATSMGLASNDNYRKQAGTMLQWRAITACARLACPEALYGVAYSPDEIDDMPRATVTAEHVNPAQARIADALRPTGDPLVTDDPGPITYNGDEDADDPLLTTTSSLAKALYATIGKAGIPESQRIAFLASAVGRELTSSKELRVSEVKDILDNFDALLRSFVEPDLGAES
jgi:hypothetical protein